MDLEVTAEVERVMAVRVIGVVSVVAVGILEAAAVVVLAERLVGAVEVAEE